MTHALRPGSLISGFVLDRQEYIPELDSTILLLTHQTLGCQAVAIKNADPNKTFCVSLSTVPQDSTGVAHILEHSVLMGSRKYPVRDVFGEINKGGLMTFLNAMTGSDTTWYPFATRNSKEYFQIMDVYCDVVFHPLLLRSTFEQEGWHYHLEEAEGPIQYTGVVFNEMKGAYSDPIRALFRQAFKALMPGSTYAHESGGDPRKIPELSYEQFVDFHSSHYHPANSTFFFYGDAPLAEELAFIQERFLAAFPTPVPKAQIKEGHLLNSPVFIEEGYPVQPGSDTSGKTFLSINSLVGSAQDRELNTAFHIIANILFNSDGSPLKKAIINANFCKDFGGVFLSDSSRHTMMITYLIGSDQEKRDHFLALYRNTLGRMAAGPLDRDLVLSELNRYEFAVREEMNKAQRGLDMISRALPAMKYGLLPFEVLKMDELLAEIRRKALEEGYFEELIRSRLLDNPATATVSLVPDEAKAAANQQDEQARLDAFTSTLDAGGRAHLRERTRELAELQTVRNSDADLRCLPRLQAADLEPQPHWHAVQESALAGAAWYINELPTNGICYFDLGLDCSGLPAELLPYLELFGSLLTEIGTKNKDYMQFAKAVNLCTGDFSTSFQVYPKQGNAVRPILWLHVKALSGYLEQAIDLVCEVFRELNLEDEHHIEEIVQREYAWAEHSAHSEGYSLAASRAFAHLSRAGQYKEHVHGMQAHLQLKDLARHYPEQEQNFLEALRRMQDLLFRRQGLCFATTAEETDIRRFRELAPRLSQALTDKPVQPEQPQFAHLPTAQGFFTPSEVVYNIQACTLFPETSRYNGAFEVLRTWISRDYLWNTVRQMNGAYGCFIQFSHLTGNFGMVSYRDPQVSKTYAAYEALPAVIAKLDLSADNLQQLIVGAYGALTPHQGPASLGAMARNDYLSGITPAFKQRRLEEVLATSLADLRGFAPEFQALCKAPLYRASIGNQEKILQDKALFDELLSL